MDADKIRALAKRAKVDISGFRIDQLQKGIESEGEHDRPGPTDVIHGTGEHRMDMRLKIAAAHLKEKPDYYTRLKKVEEMDLTEGFFSQKCQKCKRSILNPYSINRKNAWMNQAVAITPEGQVHRGSYDGYGSIGGVAHGLDTDDEGNFKNTVYHEACWELAGKPTQHKGASPHATDQGHFINPATYNRADPRTPEGAPPPRAPRKKKSPIAESLILAKLEEARNDSPKGRQELARALKGSYDAALAWAPGHVTRMDFAGYHQGTTPITPVERERYDTAGGCEWCGRMSGPTHAIVGHNREKFGDHLFCSPHCRNEYLDQHNSEMSNRARARSEE